MSWLNNIFSWFKGEDQTSNPTKRAARRPTEINTTEDLQCNIALTKGLYHNSYPGMKLAGSMCYTPIATILWLMGVPTPSAVDNDTVQEIIKNIVEDKILQMMEIHLQCHRDGTCWIYPHYSTKENKVLWEFLRDEYISDIIKDIDTGKIIKLITDEQITLSIGYNQTAIVRRQRIFTESKIEIKYLSGQGSVPGELKDRVQRNILGMMPIPFANNKDGDEVRGHSDYERIITDLKNYHDVELQLITFLSKFNPKMIQNVNNVDNWIAAQPGINGDASNLRIDTIDLIFNLPDEKTEFIFPERAYQSFLETLKNIFRKIVEGSGLAEILWGAKVEGNKASAEIQLDMVIKLVNDKRIHKNKAYEQLFDATIKLEMLSGLQRQSDYKLEIEWDNLDAISEETKSIIFKNFADAISTLINSAGITKEQIYKLYVDLYPNATGDDFEVFKKGLTEMASHKQFKDETFSVAADMQGLFDIDENLYDETTDGEEKETENKLRPYNIKNDINLIKEDLIKLSKGNGNGHGKIEQPISIYLEQQKQEQPEINIDVKPAEINIPKQPVVIKLNETKKKKNITLRKDENNNIIGADIEEI